VSRARLAFLLCVAPAAACRQDMHDQPRHEALERSSFFPDRRSARPQVPGTIARGELRSDTLRYAGKEDGQPADRFPYPVTTELLQRGRERYDIHCSPCHDRTGSGDGLIVQRGLKRPPSLHVDRLRAAPPGYYFDVISNGFGAMYDLSDRLAPDDRWAIVAYVRALQLSQSATLDDVPEAARADLEATR
jgi:mono/diheme cytochrome c family protein